MVPTTFTELGFNGALLKAIIKEGYSEPTPIQQQAIPCIREGHDILASAQTGTGKTAAFALPILENLNDYPTFAGPKYIRALVVAPTRELAAQINDAFTAYGRFSGFKNYCVFGGVGKSTQIHALAKGVDILIATPGRLLDLITDGAVSLQKVEIAVFDEADRMLDMGFIRDVKKIVTMLPKKRQTLLFSATMAKEIEELARNLLQDPVRIAVKAEEPTVERINQKLFLVSKEKKRDLLTRLITEQHIERAIVFSRTKHGADKIGKILHSAGIENGVIHANKGQGNRTKTMEAFRRGDLRVLVATDIAARGIDVDGITHVFNFDMPTEPETYVHRIGRTARAGAEGTAISFCDDEEKKLLKQVERLIKKQIPVERAV